MEEIEQRRRAEESLRLVSETIDDVFWMSTPGIQEMTYVSPGYEKIWAVPWTVSTKLQSHSMESIHPEDRERLPVRY